MQLKHFLIALLFGALLEVASSPIRGYLGFQTSSLLGFLLFHASTFFLATRNLKNGTPAFLTSLGVALGFFAIQADARLFHFHAALISLPDFLMRLAGILAGFLQVSISGRLRLLPFAAGLALASFVMLAGQNLWLHHLSYGSFSGNAYYELPAPFSALDRAGNTLSEEAFQDKIVVLDFWHSRCGICFKKFPLLQELYDQYQTDEAVLLYAVNKPLKQDTTGQAFDMIARRAYTFPVLVAADEHLPETYGVKGYPTCFVIYDNKVIYKGGIENVGKVVERVRKGR